METTRRESRGFFHLINSLNSAWDQNILFHQFEFIDNPVTPSPSEDQEGHDPPFFRLRREPLLISRELLNLPFCINKIEEELIGIQFFCLARCRY